MSIGRYVYLQLLLFVCLCEMNYLYSMFSRFKYVDEQGLEELEPVDGRQHSHQQEEVHTAISQLHL